MTDDTLVYDGSFNGFLSLVFAVYDRKVIQPVIVEAGNLSLRLFSSLIHIETNETHANRVWKKFKEKTDSQSAWNFYAAFLSELDGIESDLLGFMQYVFDHKNSVASNFGNKHVLRISQVAKMVHREKHRMEAFVRFQRTTDNLYYAAIEPDFNVLPLIAKHFTQRYADQQWVIYDLKRKYGLFYNLKKTEEVTVQFSAENAYGLPAADQLHESEEFYQSLWKNYFSSVNISSRNNRKLHLQHVPKRYWKYLTEKMPNEGS